MSDGEARSCALFTQCRESESTNTSQEQRPNPGSFASCSFPPLQLLSEPWVSIINVLELPSVLECHKQCMSLVTYLRRDTPWPVDPVGPELRREIQSAAKGLLSFKKISDC